MIRVPWLQLIILPSPNQVSELFSMSPWCRHHGSMLCLMFATLVNDMRHLRQLRGTCNTYDTCRSEHYWGVTDCPPKYEVRRCELMTEILCRRSSKGIDLENLTKAAHTTSNKYHDIFQNPRQAYLCLDDQDLRYGHHNIHCGSIIVLIKEYSHRRYTVDLYSDNSDWS